MLNDMKIQYLIFAGECYYPRAGAGDLIATSDLLKTARITAELLQKDYDWVIVYSLISDRNIIQLGEEPLGGWEK